MSRRVEGEVIEPGERSDAGTDDPFVRISRWEWSGQAPGRSRVPFMGIFLVVFGILLLLERVIPGSSLWSWLSLALGLAAIAAWVTRRSMGWLYVGIVLVAVGLPSILQAAGIVSGPGWGTLFLGLALVGIGLARRTSGIPLTVWAGIALTILGASQTLVPNLASWFWPLLVIGLGVLLIVRATSH